MGKRITSFLLALVMVIGMIPASAIPTFAAETSQSTASYDALVATGVTVDGALDEAQWHTGGKLSGGQPFDILWDGGNLYFAVETNVAGAALTVKVGNYTLLTAQKADTASAIEAKVGYVTEGVSKIENVTLSVGASTWTGTVNLVQRVRENLDYADLTRHATQGQHIAPNADGDGFAVDIPALASPSGNMTASYIYQPDAPFLADNPSDLGIEFDFDPISLPAVSNKPIGDGWPSYSGMRLIVAKKNGTAIEFCLHTDDTTGNVTLTSRPGSNSAAIQAVDLGRTCADGVFRLKLLWKADKSMDVYVDGAFISNIAVAEATDAQMANTSAATNQMIYITGHRYGWSFDDYRKNYYKDTVQFVMSDLVLSKPATVTYSATDAFSVAQGTHEALVAQDIVLDGALNEVAWSTDSKLGKGQLFDILFDGSNLYFGVKAAEGDETMTVKVGDKTVATVNKGANGAFEAKVEYETGAANGILEDVTITVGKSVWTGDVKLVEMTRVEQFTKTNMTTGVSGTAPSGSSVTAVNDGAGIRFYMPGATATNNAVPAAAAQKTVVSNIDRTQSDYALEFHFDPTSMPYIDGVGALDANNSIVGGFSLMLTDNAGEAICVGIASQKNSNLYINTMNAGVDTKRIHLSRKAADGAFDVKLLWKMDDSLEIFIDGVSVANHANATTASEKRGSEYTTNNFLRLKGTRYQKSAAHGLSTPVDITLTDIKLVKSVKVDYVDFSVPVTAQGNYEAYIGENITLDGQLNEASWLANGVLGKGQPFGILFDGSNLYFAVVPNADDVAMTVKIGDTVVATASVATKRSTSVLEVSVPYNTRGVETLEDVSIIVDKADGRGSAWTGDVTLTNMARQEGFQFSDMASNHYGAGPQASGTVTATADGQGIAFRLDTAEPFTTTAQTLRTLYAMKYVGDVLKNRTGTVAVEFTLDPTDMPVVDAGIVGANQSVWGGMDMLVVDAAGDAIAFGIANTASGMILNATITVNNNGKYEGKRVAQLNLGRTAAEGAFDVKILWTGSNYEVFVNGVNKGTVTNGVTSNEIMGHTSYTADNMVHIRASRYDYKRDDGRYYADKTLGFTVSDIKLSKVATVAYNGHAALVAEDIVLDGELNETVWDAKKQLSAGQPFDILWDGGNLYVGVKAAAGDTSMTVQVNGQTLTTATLAEGASAFEVQIPYTTKGVASLDSVVITVGSSSWAGSVDLVKEVRYLAPIADMPTAVTKGYETSSTATKLENGIHLQLTAATAAATVQRATLYQSDKNPIAFLSNRMEDLKVSFVFSADALPVTDHYTSSNGKIHANTVGNSVVSWASPAFLVSDGAGEALSFGIWNVSQNVSKAGLILVSHHSEEYVELGKTLADGPFQLDLVWSQEATDKLTVYVDGKQVGTLNNVTKADNAMVDYKTNQTLAVIAMRHNGESYGYYSQTVDFTVTDLVLTKPVDVVYEGDVIANTGVYDAFYATDITVDSKLDELSWRTGGKLGKGQPFDILFDGKNLYVAVVAAAGDKTLTVKIGDQVIIDNAALAAGATVFEAKAAYSTKGIKQLENVTVTVGGSAWTGTVNLVNYQRVYKFEAGSSNVSRAYQWYGNSSVKDYTNFNLVTSGDSFTMSNAYKEGAPNMNNGRIYALQIGNGFNLAETRTGDVAIEFDFHADSLPGYSNKTNIGSMYAAYGLAGTISDSHKDGIQFGIKKNSDDGKLYLVIAWDDVDSDAQPENKHVAYVCLDKVVGDAFSVRLVWTVDNDVAVYADGVLKGTVKNCLHKNTIGTSTFGFNLWGPGAACALTADGSNDNKFTVSNVRISQEKEDKVNAFFSDLEPNADFLCNKGWESAQWNDFINCDGKAAALVYNQKVYLAVDAQGSIAVTLGGETKTAAANGIVVLTFDETTVTKYGQSIDLKITVDGVSAWDYNGKLVVNQGVMNPGGVMPLTDAKSRTTIADGVFTMKTTDSISSSNCAFILQRKDLNDLASADSDLFFEQMLNIVKMSRGSKTGTFDNNSPSNNHGYTVLVEYPNDTLFSAVIVPDENNKLVYRAFTADKSVKQVDLGVSVGEEFKLGLLFGANGNTTVLVNGAVVGTVENARFAGTVYNENNVTLLLKYQDAVCNAENPAEITGTVPTLTKLGNIKQLCSLEEEITKEVIFGSTDLTNAVADLYLPTSFDSAYLGTHQLHWTSTDNTVVDANGTTYPNQTAAGSAKLDIHLDGSTLALWSVDVTVPTIDTALNALLSGETVEVNGQLRESVWLDWMRFGHNVPGTIAAAWTKGYAFFALHAQDADTLKLTINGKVITADLNNVTINANGATIAKDAKSGVVEIGIPLSAFDFNLTDYNQSVPFSAVLSNGSKSASLKVVKLNFSGDIAELLSMSGYTKNNGPWTLLPTSISYKGSAPGKVEYVYKTDNNIDRSQTFTLSNEFLFEALPVTSGAMLSAAQADGFYYYFGDEDPDSRSGITVCAAIYTEDGKNLKLRIGQGAGNDGYVFDLGKTVGEKFRVTYYWYPNNDLDVIVDGVLMGTVPNAGMKTSYIGIDVITYRYYSQEASIDKVRFTVSNQTKLTTKYNTVLDELNQNTVFGRVDLDHVQSNLPMVTSYTSANFEKLNLKWTTSDSSVVTADGVVTRHATQAKSATVTLYYVGEGGAETKLWSVKVTVDPMSVTKQAAPSIINTGFAKPNTVKVDNFVEFEENWLLNGWVLNAQEQPVGYFGAQWDQENLYLLLKADTETVTVTVNGKQFTYTIAGAATEVQIPVSELGLEKIQQYGTELPITVTVGNDSYTGTLKLTNVSWWATDNIYAGLPMLDGNVKSVSMGTADKPNGNQGAKQLENGWHLYDLYKAGSTNPAGIRTYVLFMKMPVYENFADRTQATHIEFDFYAKALPVWEWNEAMENDIGRAFANYGVTFSLSDKADAAKNSNVAVFGIINTTEGLVLVVNRGSENSEYFKLNKQVGEEFRIGLTWMTTSNLVLSIDGEEITTISDMSKFVNSVGDTSFVVNMIRNKVNPTSSADDMDVYLTNIGFGKAHASDNIIRNLTFADIAKLNDSEEEIISDLNLPASMTNGQLDIVYPLTWTSSDPATIDPATGKVTRPEAGVKVVTLKATLDNNGTIESKEFTLIVVGDKVDNGNALVVTDDTTPFTKGATTYKGMLFNLDKNNNSIVYAFPEGADTKINLITLTDLDEVSRLNRESLRLFVSNDNKVYTEIKNYKLHHDGCNWYLYNFVSEYKYIKVHYTHRDVDDTNFINTPGDMISVAWDASLAIPAGAEAVGVPATTLKDQAVALTLPEGIKAEGLRVALGNDLLFHYVDKNGTVYVRIPDPTTGVLSVWNGNGVEIADKENVYEVTYGTRETLPTGGRWVLSMKAGQTFPDGSKLDVDTLYSMGGNKVVASVDGGYTWTNVGTVDAEAMSSGGWGIDSKTGRLFHEFYIYEDFASADMNASRCYTYVYYSDDGGKNWTRAQGLGRIAGDKYSNYVLSYTDLTELKDNDGTGPNVDFVFPMGAQYNNNGSFCSRVAYTKDGGLSWSYSDSLITFGNETAFEGGVSEATILEREDRTLVFYARCQSAGVDNFTISYSLDHGVTWLTPGKASSIYTTNTQALMMTYDFDGFDGDRTTGSPIFMWGGNNVLGGSSYMRMPLNFAVSTNEMDTWRNVQNIFSETFMDTFTFVADHYITNPSIQQINGDDMYMTFSRLRTGDSIYMVVNDFTDWFTRTKGAYDSFEHGTAIYEGWVLKTGAVEATKNQAYEGKYSMYVMENTQIGRTVPYLQNGKLSIALYVDAKSDFVLELQPAFSVTEQKCAVISAKVTGTTMKLHDGTVFNLKTGWNTVSMDLELTEWNAKVGVNGGEMKPITVNRIFNGNTFDKSETVYDLSNSVTYVTVLATNAVYVDELLIESTLDAVMEATSNDKAAANAVIEQIKNISDCGDAQEAMEAFNALTQVQKDLVDRNVTTGKSTNANAAGALINYYDVLVAAMASNTHSYTAAVTAPTCEAEGYTTYTCQCGHSYTDNIVPATGHDYKAAITLAPTCTEEGVMTYTCQHDQSHTYTEVIEANGHSYGNLIPAVDAVHTKDELKAGIAAHYICSDCANYFTEDKVLTTWGALVGETPVHSYTSVVTDPTCTEQGYTTHTCECGHVVVDTFVNEKGHKHEAVVTAPTCTEQGYTTYTCACGDSYVADYVDATGHSYEGVETKAPTCTEKGEMTYTCKNDPTHTYTEEIAAKGHKYEAAVTAPTCTEQGYTTYTCACGDTYKDNYVDATGHSHQAVVTAPTCEAEGYTTYTCHCGDTYVADKVAAKGHSYEGVETKAPTCTETGEMTYTCKNDPTHTYTEEIAAKGHKYEAAVTAPTCTEQGYTTYTCACGDTYKDNYVDATGHSHQAVVTAPTCTEQGYTTYTCACGDSYVTNYVDATGHSYGSDHFCSCGAEEPVYVAFYSLSLKGDIGVNYYLHIDESILADETAFMRFTMADGDTVEIPVSKAERRSSNGVTYYGFTATVSAKEMTDIIVGQFIYSGGESAEKKYSVKAYAETILENKSGSKSIEKVQPLVRAMLNYGAFAQIQFKYNTDNLAADISGVDLSGVTAETLQSFANSTKQGTALAPLYASSLFLKSETNMRLIFNAAEGVAVTATCGEKALAVNIVSGMQCVEVTNISAKDLDTWYEVEINDGTETATVTYNPMTYGYNVLNAKEGTYAESLVNLVKALYLYNQAANGYFE